jgi:2-aminobenzoate-CoA ligase
MITGQLPGVPRYRSQAVHPESEGTMEMSGGIPDLLKPSLGPSGHVDDFARRNLPPQDQWPELRLDQPEFQYPDYLNIAVELTDRIVEKGLGDNVALIGNGRQRTYKELADWSNRLAHALVENYGVKPGNRVLIRSGLRRQRPAPSSSTPCRCCAPAS